jgi:hypothetical protein
MRVTQATLIFAILCGVLCGGAHFFEWLPVFATRNAPIADGRIVARSPIRRLGIVPGADFTIRIEESGAIVHARTQRYLMQEVPDTVRFRYSGDPTREVFLFEEEESPLAIFIVCFVGSAFLGYVLFRYRRSSRVRQLLSGAPITISQ